MNIELFKKGIEKNYRHSMRVLKSSPNDKFSKGFSEALEGVQKMYCLLDEPKKVVIPQFVADWIEEAKLYSGNEVDPLGIIYWMGDYIGSKEPHCEWLKNIYNQKLLLNAIVNGYEVEEIEDE